MIATKNYNLYKQVNIFTITCLFVILYNSVGWGAYDEEISKIALDNTFYSVSVYDEDKIIGYGRLIGDIICYIYTGHNG